jgi:tRNA(Ile)-lysidine synthase
LLPGSRRPITVALSGGGDSIALLLAAAEWAAQAERELVVLTVDHRLQSQSAAWTRACAATATRLGLAFRSLDWTAEKPVTGLPAAARAARHTLLAEAARDIGARVILMGHTADDLLEAQLMRASGSTTPDPRGWSPSPVWPQGRGLFLLRPLLSIRRSAIRDWLKARAETWIDDPANLDLGYARPRARQALARPPSLSPARPEEPLPNDLAIACRPDAGGGLELDRDLLRGAATLAAQRFVAAACLCAAGEGRPPASVRVQSLTDRLTGVDDVIATLAGARIEAVRAIVRVEREAGEASRGGLAPLRLAAGQTGVWDGRFEIRAEQPCEVRRLAGQAGRLSSREQKLIKTFSPNARRALPAVVDATGSLACPTVGEVRGLRLRPLGYDRLLAACGAVDREPA